MDGASRASGSSGLPGSLFVWLGLLKQFGVEPGTSLIARTIYWGSADVIVPLLGVWEVAIGVCLACRPLVRVALLLLAVRLPGTALALVFHADVAFGGWVLSPTLAGPFLIKDLMLFSAALVIGGSVRFIRVGVLVEVPVGSGSHSLG